MYITNALSQTILFPFAALMVQSFNVTDDPAKLGYFAGYLASSAFTGSLLSSAFWGILSDKIGRKPVLLLGLGTNFVCALMFGLSPSFKWAMTVRFVNGLFSTIAATGRSAVAELCNKSNQAQGFALIGTTFGAGLLIGPALGGFLSLPVEKYPSYFHKGSLFDQFPFLLPCLVLAILTLLGFVSTFIFLPETLGRAKAKTSEEEGEVERANTGTRGTLQGTGNRNGEVFGGGLETTKDNSLEGLRTPLLNSGESERKEIEGERYAGSSDKNFILGEGVKDNKELLKPENQQMVSEERDSKGIDERSKKTEVSKRESKGPVSTARFLEVLFSKDTVISALIFCVLSFASTSFNEVFPIWCVTPWEIGGLSLGTNSIAIAQTSAGVVLIPFQYFVYAPLVNRFGPAKAFQIGVAAGVIFILFPLVRNFGQATLELHIALGILMAFRSFPQCVFTSVFILISNSVEDPHYLGAVNGFTQTLNMVFRAVAPTAAGSFYAWSTSQRGALFNSFSWFYVIVFMYGFMFFLASLLSPAADARKFTTVGDKKEEASRNSSQDEGTTRH